MLELEKGTYILLYIQGGNPHPLCKVNPDTFKPARMQKVITAYRSCMNSSTQLDAVKTTIGYKTIASCSPDTVFSVSSLSVIIKPTKTKYQTGSKYDFTGVKIIADAEDGRVFDITEEAMFIPANGSSVTSPDTTAATASQISVVFRGKSTSFDVAILPGIAISELSITPPTKTVYQDGEQLDYTGCVITAVYADGSTKDVTSSAVFSLANGSMVNRSDVDKDGKIPITVTYQEGTETIARTMSISVTGETVWFDALKVTLPAKTQYGIGETIDYTGLKVEVSDGNGGLLDVTSSVVITPPNGTVITKDALTRNVTPVMGSDEYSYDDELGKIVSFELNLNITYTDASGNEMTASIPLMNSAFNITYPDTFWDFWFGYDALDYTGFKLELNGADITQSAVLNPVEGTILPPEAADNDTLLTYITYTTPDGIVWSDDELSFPSLGVEY